MPKSDVPQTDVPQTEERGERISDRRKTEIIAFCSGKGGTGKSLMCACFGYALLRGGQRVLMIDGDPATDGLSLFLLGPKGQDQIPSFTEENTFIGSLERFQKTGNATFEPRAIHRRGEDHGVTYSAIISGKGLYGEGVLNLPAVPDLNQSVFRAGIRHLFDQLRGSGEYDYVLVDTRGGFAFESTDLCALADSFIVITEPDYTSFYQDRNLVSRVAAAARDVESPSLLRAMIVNKAVDTFPKPGKAYLDTLEVLFRDQLVKEFPVRFQDTHPVPVSIEALLAYKAQKIPYKSAPESLFCLATLSAFSDILEIVTSRWSEEQVDQWNVLVDTVAQAVKDKQEKEKEREEKRLAHELEFEQLRIAAAESEAKITTIQHDAAGRLEAVQRESELRVTALERELQQRNLLYEREYARSEALIGTTIAQAASSSAAAASPAQEPAARTKMWLPTPPSPPSAAAPSAQRVPVQAPVEAPGPRWGRIIAGIVAFLLVVGVLVAFLLPSHRSDRQGKDGNEGTKSVTTGEQRQAGALNPSTGTPYPANTGSGVGVVPPPVSVSGAIPNNYAVLLAAGKALKAAEPGAPSAAYEAQLGMQAGYKVIALYQRNGRYTAAALFNSQEEAATAMKALQTPFNGRWASTSSTVTMSEWCPVKTAQDPIVINNAEIPVWLCITFPSTSNQSTSNQSTRVPRAPNAPPRLVMPNAAPRLTPKM